MKIKNIVNPAVFVFFTVIYTCFSIPVNADDFDENGYSLRFNQCMDHSEGVTVNMQDCISEELKVQDKLLNSQYQKAMKSLDKEQQKLLKEAQRAWLKMRENDSQLILKSNEGSLGRIDAASSFLNDTVLRVKFLKGINEQ